MTDSRQQLLDQIACIRSNKNEIGNLPAKVDQWSGYLVATIRTAGYSSVQNPLGAFDVENTVDEIWGNRDKINTAIRDTWDKLDATSPDLEAPVKLIDTATNWRKLKGDIYAAEADFNDTSLFANWQGEAAGRYMDLRERQGRALESLPEVCEEIAVSLETVSAAELTLYNELATKSQEMITTVVETTNQSTFDSLDIPFGPLQAQINLLNAVQNLKVAILGIVTSMASSAQVNMVEGGKIEQNISIQRGLPDNHWPSGVSGSYGKGKDGIRVAIGDGSSTDGDESDWEPGGSA